MVLLTSRQSHFTATLRSLHPRGHPFSRSYGVMLPNSLTKVLPFALVFSTRLPVSVCGTDTRASTLRGFSRQYRIGHISLVTGITITSQAQTVDFPAVFTALRAWHDSISNLRWPTFLRHLITPPRWYRNINLLSIAYASRPRLRPD